MAIAGALAGPLAHTLATVGTAHGGSIVTAGPSAAAETKALLRRGADNYNLGGRRRRLPERSEPPTRHRRARDGDRRLQRQ